MCTRRATTGEASLQLHCAHRDGHPERAQQEAHTLRDISIPTGTQLSVYCPFSISTSPKDVERSPLFLVLQTPS